MKIASVAQILAVCLALGSCASGPEPMPTPPQEQQAASDPYLWLEDVEGERALAWVHQQNDRSLPVLENDPRYAEPRSLAARPSARRLSLQFLARPRPRARDLAARAA
jgi:hypothetical protein